VNVTATSGNGVEGLYVKLAESFELTVTVSEAVATWLFESVTVKVAAYVPAEVYAWLIELPELVPPSPKLQE
jgi:hypothetical protein